MDVKGVTSSHCLYSYHADFFTPFHSNTLPWVSSLVLMIGWSRDNETDTSSWACALSLVVVQSGGSGAQTVRAQLTWTQLYGCGFQTNPSLLIALKWKAVPQVKVIRHGLLALKMNLQWEQLEIRAARMYMGNWFWCTVGRYFCTWCIIF